MDFKVAGTKDGITALQMDIKIEGINEQILKEALAQAKVARMQILDVITSVIPEPRAELSQYAPKIESIMIPTDKIKVVIGKGGDMINSIIDETGVKIDINEDGRVDIYSHDADGIARAKEIITNITKEAKVGETYLGKVVRIEKFGAFVRIFGDTDGMVHISQLANHRVENVEDEVKLGDEILVKVVKIDDRGRIDLTRKGL
jgi:polyribonucleotide nucleotidyltransferase